LIIQKSEEDITEELYKESFVVNNNDKDIEINKPRLIININETFAIKKMNSKDIQTSLLEMGYELNLINNSISYLQINSIDQAIDYLTKIEEKWNHPFVNLELNNDNNIKLEKSRCLVCGDPYSFHNIVRRSLNKYDSFKHTNNENNNNTNNKLINFNNEENKLSRINSKNSCISNKDNLENLNIVNDINLNKSNIEDINIDILCEICLGDIFDPFDLECNHKFCRECIKEYIINKINNSDVLQIECPLGITKCKISIDEFHIKLLILEHDFSRYKKFLNRAKIAKIPDSIFCPFTNCDSYALNNKCSKHLIEKNLNNSEIDLKIIKDIKNEDSKNVFNLFLYCIENNHYFCAKCMNEAHPNENCQIKLENEFNKAIKNMLHVKRCPKCGFYIQKNDGCNHMTCANSECKYEFCWICLKQYTPNHFRDITSSCYGLSNVNQNSLMISYPYLRIFYKICIFLFIYLILPILILIAVSIIILFCGSIIFSIIYIQTLQKKFFMTNNYRNHKIGRRCISIFSLLFYFFSGIYFFPIIFSFLLLSIFICPIVVIIGFYLRRNFMRNINLERNHAEEFLVNNELPIDNVNNNEFNFNNEIQIDNSNNNEGNVNHEIENSQIINNT